MQKLYSDLKIIDMNKIKRSVLFALLLLVAMPMALVAQSDEPVTTIGGKQYYVHKVKKGETFWGLSKTYNVSVEELTAANPDAAAGLKTDAVINIPVAKKNVSSVVATPAKPSEIEDKLVVTEDKPKSTPVVKVENLDGKIRHEVLKGETIFGISHKYGVSEQELIGMNPGIESGLREGQVLVIPSKPVVAETNNNHKGELRHEVQKGETIYGISHQYGITEHDLIAMNPEIESGLKVGQTLVIPSKSKTNVDKGDNTVKVTVKPEQNTTVKVTVKEQPTNIYKVKKGETLYYVARKFGVDIADLKAANPGLTNFPIEGLPVTIPERKIADSFFVHRVEENSKTSNFVKKWNLTEEEFRAINSSVGRRVYTDQAVLIPMLKDGDVNYNNDADNDLNKNSESSRKGGTNVVKPVVVVVAPQDTIQEHKADSVKTEVPSVVETRIPCEPLSNARKATYRVALLLPLYLEEVDNIQVRSDYAENARKARPFKFLHYYEGFMMAANRLSEEGLNLDLQVIDVDENVNKAKKAIDQMKQSHVDIIIGPFFSHSFSVVSEYAAQNDIMIVNPLSERQNILENNANVVKVKPDFDTQLDVLCKLLTDKYQDALCTVFVPVGKENDSAALAMAKHIKAMVKNDTADVNVYPCNNASFKTLETLSSSKRNTVVVAYGDKLVFATQMLNSLNKTANKTPLTLVALPEWDKFENLLVDNLMRMNAIYFSDYFVDYSDNDVNDFVERFRNLYKYDPDKYAFMGYDMAEYFLNALMLYGSKPCDCLQDYSPKLMHTRFDFNRETISNGVGNTFWNIYQYDNEETVLKILNR